MLTVLRLFRTEDHVLWFCQCDCGNTAVVRGTSLRYGSTKSCGCGSLAQAKANAASGREKRRLPFPPGYRRKMQEMYRNVKSRCYDPRNHRWDNYGGRGIRVCKEWMKDRHAFYSWCMENGFRPGLQIDRIDVNAGYSPSNCRFVDAFVKQNNTTRNRVITWNGESLTIAQWARRLGVRSRALQARCAREWDVERIMTQPFRRQARP